LRWSKEIGHCTSYWNLFSKVYQNFFLETKNFLFFYAVFDHKERLIIRSSIFFAQFLFMPIGN
ncbi:MAG: hypothetical protein ACI4BH_03340, partial [Muribaculaceae bacterium]